MENKKKHYIAVIGGSIAGSEAANILAQSGFRVVVFDMNELPYGKIEDGLPKWHVNLRNKQENEIDRKLNQENIRFVPNTKIGRDITFDDLVNNWGFSAIIIANGAWQDRELQIKGINKYKDNGLVYQNDFIYWFNHCHEKDYQGNKYKIKDGAIVVGGGLASLDVVKIIMIELVLRRLREKFNIEENLFKIEKLGIDKALLQHNLSFNDLDLSGVHLVYRRNAEDMPLKSPKDDSFESRAKAKIVSAKLLNNYLIKYKFNFLPCRIPVGLIEEEESLKGLILQKVNIYNGRIIPIENEVEELRSELVISSIGSLPEQIEGLHYDNSILKMRRLVDYHVYGYDNVFAVGNAVTGRGNIQESKQHGKQITRKLVDNHFTEDALEKWLNTINNNIKESIKKNINTIIDEISSREIQPENVIDSILDRTKAINDKNGYSDYSVWINEHKPERLETLLKL